MKKNKITLTEVELLNDDMIPCIVKCPDSIKFIFLDIKTKTFCYDVIITGLWLRLRKINNSEFKNHCLKVFNSLKEENIEYGILSFFRSDSSTIEKFVENIDIEDMCKTMFKEENF